MSTVVTSGRTPAVAVSTCGQFTAEEDAIVPPNDSVRQPLHADHSNATQIWAPLTEALQPAPLAVPVPPVPTAAPPLHRPPAIPSVPSMAHDESPSGV